MNDQRGGDEHGKTKKKTGSNTHRFPPIHETALPEVPSDDRAFDRRLATATKQSVDWTSALLESLRRARFQARALATICDVESPWAQESWWIGEMLSAVIVAAQYASSEDAGRFLEQCNTLVNKYVTPLRFPVNRKASLAYREQLVQLAEKTIERHAAIEGGTLVIANEVEWARQRLDALLMPGEVVDASATPYGEWLCIQAPHLARDTFWAMDLYLWADLAPFGLPFLTRGHEDKLEAFVVAFRRVPSRRKYDAEEVARAFARGRGMDGRFAKGMYRFRDMRAVRTNPGGK